MCGEVFVQGSKNAVLPMMAASLLQEGSMTLCGCPRIADVYAMERILIHLGAKTSWKGHDLSIDCTEILQCAILDSDAESMRSSVLLMGSMLVRKNCVKIAYPGGCRIGRRPIDIHLALFQKMGVCIVQEENGLCLSAAVPLRATEFVFPIPSVGATENGILAAMGAKGVTVLKNCACEPEIFHLCHMLQQMGGKIQGVGSSTLRVEGPCRLHPVCYKVPADRIAAGTYICAAAATRGCCVLAKAPVQEMQSVLAVYEKMGGQWEAIGGKLKVNAVNVRYPVRQLVTAAYPGFPTDMQSVWMSVLLTVKGKSRIRENIFENRFQIIPQLQKMGAAVCSRGRWAYIEGGYPLHGACVEARELRGAAALMIAGLVSEGMTCIKNAHYIQRGYEEIEKQMQRLGANVWLEDR